MILTSTQAQAQEGLSSLKDAFSSDYDDLLSSGGAIAGAILAIGLIYVIWSLATNQSHAKEYLIGWVVAVLFSIILFKSGVL